MMNVACHPAGKRTGQGRTGATIALLLGVVLLGSGCSGFNRHWKEAAAQPDPARSLEGRWLGTWVSEENGHQGKLRCIITPSGDGTYQARFHARYQKILSYSYTVPLSVDIRGGLARFKGAVDLGGLAGGVYFYEGEANGAQFSATYKAQKDHGTFEMRRPPRGQ